MGCVLGSQKVLTYCSSTVFVKQFVGSCTPPFGRPEIDRTATEAESQSGEERKPSENHPGNIFLPCLTGAVRQKLSGGFLSLAPLQTLTSRLNRTCFPISAHSPAFPLMGFGELVFMQRNYKKAARPEQNTEPRIVALKVPPASVWAWKHSTSHFIAYCLFYNVSDLERCVSYLRINRLMRFNTMDVGQKKSIYT